MQGRHVNQGRPEEPDRHERLAGHETQRSGSYAGTRKAVSRSNRLNCSWSRARPPRARPRTPRSTRPARWTAAPPTTCPSTGFRSTASPSARPVALFNVLKPMSDVWDSLTQTPLIAKFKWQNTASFVPDRYGGGMGIIVDRRNRLLHVDLSGFRSKVTVGNFPGVPVCVRPAAVQDNQPWLPVVDPERQLRQTGDVGHGRHYRGYRKPGGW